MKRKTIIIGNGFDLNLGLPTSYSHFINSEYFTRLISTNKLCRYLTDTYERCNWVDIEVSLKEYAEEMNNPKTFFSDYTALKKALTRYLETITYSIDKNSVAYKFIGDCCYECFRLTDKNHITILNFNYTKSVNKVIDHIYKVGNYANYISDIPFEYWAVHGSVMNNHIVLGVEDSADIPSSCNFIKKSYDSEYTSFKTKIMRCDELIVFGHSLGETDDTVFRPFFQKQLQSDAEPKKVVIYYKGDNGYRDLLHRVDELTGYHISRFREKNRLRFKDVDDDRVSFADVIRDVANTYGDIVNSYKTISDLFKKPTKP